MVCSGGSVLAVSDAFGVFDESSGFTVETGVPPEGFSAQAQSENRNVNSIPFMIILLNLFMVAYPPLLVRLYHLKGAAFNV